MSDETKKNKPLSLPKITLKEASSGDAGLESFATKFLNSLHQQLKERAKK